MEINLLPWRDERLEYHKNALMQALLIALVFAALILFILSHVFFSDASNTKKYIATLSKANATLTQGITQYLNDKKTHEALNARLHTLQQLQNSRFETVKILNAITRLTPTGIYLTKMIRAQNSVTLSGDANSNFLISQFIKSLDASTVLQVTTLQKVEKKENSTLTVTHFDLKLALKSS